MKYGTSFIIENIYREVLPVHNLVVIKYVIKYYSFLFCKWSPDVFLVNLVYYHLLF